MSFLYYICLLFMLFFIVTLLFENKEKSPRKIKLFVFINLALFLIRYLSLILLCLISDINIVYKLKSLIYLNYLGIPLLVLGMIYINLRYSKISFNVIYIISIAISGIYCTFMYLTDGKISFNMDFGYIINLKGEIIINLFMIIIMGIFLIFSLFFVDKLNSNKRGVYLLAIFILIIIFENIMLLANKIIFPYTIISENFFLFIIKDTISNFKKSVSN